MIIRHRVVAAVVLDDYCPAVPGVATKYLAPAVDEAGADGSAIRVAGGDKVGVNLGVAGLVGGWNRAVGEVGGVLQVERGGGRG